MKVNCAKIVSTVVLLLLVVSCGGPKIVPDKELARIFHDIYLVNAYVGQNNVNVDSLNIYEPVFAAYGYTSEDIQYTIGNFSKRKSARLAEDVVEVAGEILRRESRFYGRRIEIRDTIALVARTKYAEVVYFDSLIRVRRIADTARLRIVIPDIREGSYEVSYGYMVDSTDRNAPLRTESYLLDGHFRKVGTSPRRLDRSQHGKVKTTHTVTGDHRSLVISLNGYPEDLTTPSLTIDSLTVTYYLPDAVAMQKLSRGWYGHGMIDSLIESHETHILPPFVDTTGIVPR